MVRKRTPAKTGGAATIDAVRREDNRKNTPTEELRDFVREAEQRSQTILHHWAGYV